MNSLLKPTISSGLKTVRKHTLTAPTTTGIKTMNKRPSLTQLPPEMLMTIFENLEFKDLYAIAKCCHKFEELAQRIFKSNLKGDSLYFYLISPYNLRAVAPVRLVDQADMLRIFGRFIRKFDFCSFPYDWLQLDRFWHCLDITALTRVTFNDREGEDGNRLFCESGLSKLRVFPPVCFRKCLLKLCCPWILLNKVNLI